MEETKKYCGHPIEKILGITMDELKNMVDVNTIVGSPFTAPSGASIIPISRVSFGFVSGGGEYPAGRTRILEERPSFAGGSATGVSIQPVAFLVADAQNISLLPTIQRNCLDKVFEHLPKLISQIKDMMPRECVCNETKED